MRYQMKQRLLSLGDKGVISDEHGTPVYRNNGQFFSLRDRVSMIDAKGEQVATLHSKILSFPKAFFVEIGGKEVVKITRKPLSIRMAFDITLTSGERWKLRGDWVNRSFTLEDENGALVAQATSAWVSVAGNYGIDIVDGHDDLLVLMILVALETAAHDDES